MKFCWSTAHDCWYDEVGAICCGGAGCAWGAASPPPVMALAAAPTALQGDGPMVRIGKEPAQVTSGVAYR
jgi:hypothetical protein